MMTFLSLCIALCIGSLPVAASSFDQRAAAFNPSGYFLPIAVEGNPTLVRWILLFRDKGKAGSLRVELRTGSRSQWTTFSQATLTLDGRDLQFVTKRRNGRWYEFKGTLSPTDLDVSNGSFTDDPHARSPALRGVLRSYRGSKLIRSEELTFFFSTGD